MVEQKDIYSLLLATFFLRKSKKEVLVLLDQDRIYYLERKSDIII